MKKLILVFVIASAFLNSCKDRDDFMAYSSEKVVKKYFLRGDGVWNIDEMRVWVHNQQFKTIIYDETRTNVGTFEFKKDNLFNINYTKDTIDFDYIRFGSVKDHKWEYLAGDFDWQTPTSNLVAFGHVITIDKKNMTLFFPYALNGFLTTKLIVNRDVEFEFKLSKK
jgi:hypothetical protein